MAQENACRPCWQNCGLAQADDEMQAIDAMEDTLGPLDKSTTQIRHLITGFEVCYHEGAREAERIIKAIGDGHGPPTESDRPAARQEALVHAKTLLTHWCQGPTIQDLKLDIEGIPGRQFLSSLGKSTGLKRWQVSRIINKINEGLDSSQPYVWLAFNMETHDTAAEHFQEHMAFLEQTRKTMIHDTVDGQKASISLAMAIDLCMPCHWDWAHALLILLQAIGGNLTPQLPYACCARNVQLSPLCARIKGMSDTLHGFCMDERDVPSGDSHLLACLGELTPVKQWLAASLDKTIRIQLNGDTHFWLDLGH